MDWGSTRTPDTGAKAITWGVGYEYYIDRKFNGVSVEVLGQKLGGLFKGPQDWWVGTDFAAIPKRTPSFLPATSFPTSRRTRLRWALPSLMGLFGRAGLLLLE
jgi:hypothetical protein